MVPLLAALEFEHPLRLIWLAIAPVIVYFAIRSRTSAPARRRAASLVCRLLILTLAAGSDEPVTTPGRDEPSPEPVNIVNRVESDIRAGANVASRDVLSPAPTREQPLWMLLAGLAVVLLLSEWCLFHRRVVV